MRYGWGSIKKGVGGARQAKWRLEDVGRRLAGRARRHRRKKGVNDFSSGCLESRIAGGNAGSAYGHAQSNGWIWGGTRGGKKGRNPLWEEVVNRGSLPSKAQHLRAIYGKKRMRELERGTLCGALAGGGNRIVEL